MRIALMALLAGILHNALPANLGTRPDPPERVPPEIVLRFETPAEEPLVLVVRLEVRGSAVLRILPSDLPWRDSSSFHMVAIECGTGRALQEQRGLDDVDAPEGEIPVSVTPHRSITGRIYLQGTFLRLEDALKVGEVCIFWTYRPFPVGQPPPPRMAGWLLMSRFGLHQSEILSNKR